MRYPPAHVDRVLHDGDTVQLGGTVLTAHLTPATPRGTTTWTMDEPEGGSRFAARGHRRQPECEPGYKLVATRPIRKSLQDYKRGFRVLDAHCPATSFSVRTAPTSGSR
jgi:metallo-beta-lactamase class B